MRINSKEKVRREGKDRVRTDSKNRVRTDKRTECGQTVTKVSEHIQ